MEEGFKIRHPASHEAAVLANLVATERRLSGRYIAIQKGEQLFGGVLFIQRGSAHPFDQSRTAMHFLIPRIHAFKHFIALMERQRRPFNRDVKTGIRHNNGNFKNAIRFRPQTAHFHVQPDNMAFSDRLACAVPYPDIPFGWADPLHGHITESIPHIKVLNARPRHWRDIRRKRCGHWHGFQLSTGYAYYKLTWMRGRETELFK